jgi:hypothetical protein
LWGGLWEPPTGEIAAGEEPERAAQRVARTLTGLGLDGLEPLQPFEHVLTHRRMLFSPFRARPRGRVKLGGDAYDAAQWLDAAGARGLGVSAWTARLLRSLA